MLQEGLLRRHLIGQLSLEDHSDDIERYSVIMADGGQDPSAILERLIEEEYDPGDIGKDSGMTPPMAFGGEPNISVILGPRHAVRGLAPSGLRRIRTARHFRTLGEFNLSNSLAMGSGFGRVRIVMWTTT